MDLHQRETITQLGQSMPIALPYKVQDNLQKFLKGEPVILGVAQVLIGLMNISLWIMLKILFFTAHTHIFINKLEFSYNFFLLGPILFITSGTLSIMSAKKLTKNLIQGSLIVNTVSAMSAILSMILIAWSEVSVIYNMLNDLTDEELHNHPYLLFSFSAGIMAVILILFLLEVIISLSLSAFGCNTICCDHRPVVICVPSNDNALPSSTPDNAYEMVV
ncbi:membrane-spanning 4-domains subfamily A member 4A-like isoform X1 [Tamandua tetradactyla]|uniref:membrane-spanning 4-domains subfamily A member 4A-like isoform X1 n=1 Tax=Tamandua tetradactyla TaxID=48850 RepID=UPI004053B878